MDTDSHAGPLYSPLEPLTSKRLKVIPGWNVNGRIGERKNLSLGVSSIWVGLEVLKLHGTERKPGKTELKRSKDYHTSKATDIVDCDKCGMSCHKRALPEDGARRTPGAICLRSPIRKENAMHGKRRKLCSRSIFPGMHSSLKKR